MKYISHTIIEKLLLEVFLNKGVDSEVASITANGLTYASLRGVDSHGIRLFFHYLSNKYYNLANDLI